MGFLELNIEKSPKGYRMRRLLAFLIDALIIILLCFTTYNFLGKPDYYSVQIAMDAAEKAAGTPQAQELANEMFVKFDKAYSFTLIIWFVYEVVTQLLLRGATIGKLLLNLKVDSTNPDRKWIVNQLLLVVRVAVKMLSLYILQGFPFLICQLTIFTNRHGRSGVDMFARTKVSMKKEVNVYENKSNCAA